MAWVFPLGPIETDCSEVASGLVGPSMKSTLPSVEDISTNSRGVPIRDLQKMEIGSGDG